MASLLPNGEQYFADSNGTPLAGGEVYMYVPNTTTFKDTWQDPNSTIANTNPITLDAAGRAIIYGTGSYRQVVYAANGDLVWDQLTADTAVGGISNGGTSTGSANAQIIAAGNFSSQDGQVVSFVAGYTNNAALTIQPGSGSPIPALIDSVTGPTPCVGGEVYAGNEVILIYDSSRGAFHIVNPATGTMSRQNANAVAITGGTITGVSSTPTSLIIPSSALPLPTTLGDIRYGTRQSTIVVGNGSSQSIYWPNPSPGTLWGLTLSNNGSDATNDIDFAVGTATDSTNAVYMSLASGLTKQLDATWVAGNNAGGRFSAAAIANTTYHCFVIYNPTTGAVDCGFDTSVTAANIPSGYTYYRRIGSIVRSGGAIKAFTQRGDRFIWAVQSADVSANNPGTSAVTGTLTVPTGLVMTALLNTGIAPANSAGTFYMLVTALYQTDTTPSVSAFTVINAANAGNNFANNTEAMVDTNTSAQVRYRVSTSTAAVTVLINTIGWIDTRGRLA